MRLRGYTFAQAMFHAQPILALEQTPSSNQPTSSMSATGARLEEVHMNVYNGESDIAARGTCPAAGVQCNYLLVAATGRGRLM